MTICIAAISEEDKIVAITDKMLTLQVPVTTTYEINENNKAIKLNESVVALFAGDVLHANAILKKSIDKLDTHPSTTVKEIADVVNASFTEHWSDIITNFLMRRFQIKHDQFMHNQGSFDADLVKQINQFILGVNINVEIIVAGKHGDDKSSHIYTIDNGGTVMDHNSMGYACIGSGSQHATFSLIESQINIKTSIDASMMALIKAKRRAEYDPGVGKLCDVVVIDDKVDKYTTDKVQKINAIFDKIQVAQDRILNKSLTKLKAII